jgi:1,4-alpha-glucan branching enzyme
VSEAPVGTFCLVLHSHLPWLAGHGRWPVGEEWLHQAWAQSYIPLADLLHRLGEAGGRDLLTVGLTPVLAAQLDDPSCLDEHERWLSDWMLRADDLSGDRDPYRRSLGRHEGARARATLRSFGRRWRAGGSPVWRSLVDSGVVEVLGGPLTHPVLPLLAEPVADLALGSGLDDHLYRLGHRPDGIWLPECAYRPGLESLLARHGVTHLMLDGPTLQHVGATTSTSWLLGDSDVAVVGRDLDVTYRVWSPRRGYPGGRWYRDFHAYHHESGFKLFRVTGTQVPAEDKAWYEPDKAAAAVRDDVDDFVSVVHRRLTAIAAESGRPGLVVAAYDTELFGHWWHEGLDWLAGVLAALPAVGVRVTTLSQALEHHPPADRVRPETGSWGLGKDLAVWAGPQVSDMQAEQARLQQALLSAIHASRLGLQRDRWLDELAESVLLGCASDWPFMVSHDSSPDYARARLRGHAADVDALVLHRRPTGVRGPFGHVDARRLSRDAAAG